MALSLGEEGYDTIAIHFQGSQFTLSDVEVITATVDLEEVRSYRGASLSRGMQVISRGPRGQENRMVMS